MGKSFKTDKAGPHKDFLEERGYHSLKAFDGKLEGAWEGFINYPEYVVYNHTQVLVTTIFIYEYCGNGLFSRVSRAIPRSVIHHPCKRAGRVCKSAYGGGGCIMTQRKDGCTEDDAKYCHLYD